VRLHQGGGRHIRLLDHHLPGELHPGAGGAEGLRPRSGQLRELRPGG
jgi:hypothetical protein